MTKAWTLSGNFAELATAPLAARVQPAQPAQGLERLVWRNSGLEATRFFGVRWAHGEPALGPVSESFVREQDLVVVYAEQPGRALRVQLYWRAISCACNLPATSSAPAAQETIHGVELIVSVQTSLLDSDPALRVTSTLGWERGAEIRELLATQPAAASEAWDFHQQPLRASTAGKSTGAYLIRWPERDFTGAQMIYPSDFEQSDLRWAGCNGPAECSHTLFEHHLEKGVIRRARLRTVFVPRARDEDWTAAALAEFAASPLPLTA